MTDEEILKIASEHFCCNVSIMEYSCRGHSLLEFARALLREGYHQGVNDGQGHD